MLHSPGYDSDVIQVQSIEVTPDPPQPGKDLALKVVGVVGKVIQVSSNPLFNLRRL